MVPALLLGTYTRGGILQSGHGTTPEVMCAYTLSGTAGRLIGCTSAPGSTWVGWMLATTGGGGVIVGAVKTTAVTTAAGLRMAREKTNAKMMRSGRDRKTPDTRLFVREVFQFGGKLAHPTAIVQA